MSRNTSADRLLTQVLPVVSRNVDEPRSEEFARNVSQILMYEPGPVDRVALTALDSILYHVDELKLPVTGELIDFARDLGRAWERWFDAESRRVGIEAARGMG